MATNAPAIPTLTTDDKLRTINSVSLHFAPNADDGGSPIVGYALFRDEGLAGSPFSQIYDGSSKPGIIDYVDENLQTSLTYTYRLYSMNPIFKSSDYSQLTLKIGLPPSQPGKPVFTASSFASGTITFNFSIPANIGGWPVTSYLIYVDDGFGNWGAPISISPITLSYQATGLTGGQTYGFKVKAVNDIGTSLESDSQYFVCADLPDAPNAPIFELATHTSITIAWNLPANNGGASITGYRVYMNALDQGDWNLVYNGVSQPTKLSWREANLKPGGLYRFKVSALNLVGESPQSPETTILCAATPAAPS